jgi:phospholipid/cholesterol/gamma-HCH transport system ATP-binding protein
VIVLEDVEFYYGAHYIIKGVSFKVETGTTKVILGASGSGKSTLLRLMMGFIMPASGRVMIDGRDTKQMSLRELRKMRKEFGFVFQEGALFDSMTVGENVGYALFEERRHTPAEIESRVRELLNYLGLGEHLIDRMPSELSGGMQRRVAVGRALAAHNPKFLLYDEPTTGLDPLVVETITDLIIKLRDDTGVTSVVVTHEIIDALKVADSFLVLSDGQVMFEGTNAELKTTTQTYVVEYLEPFRKALKEHAIM